MRTCSSRCRPLALAALGVAHAAAPAQSVQAEPPVTPVDDELQRVLVTGSQLPQVDAETAVPVQIISREEIERSGATSIEEVVRRISANFGNKNQALGIGDTTSPGFSGVSLRGFGSQATLVLLNGRRIANYALSDEDGIGVDLQAIPLAAIDRIEVLTDSSSAVYGSGAIAGVVNFVLRQDFRGGHIDAQHSRPQAEGGGGSDRQTITLGGGALATDGFNLFAVVDHNREQHLAARDRPFSATSYRPDLGITSLPPAAFPANIQGPDGLVNPAAPSCTSNTVLIGEACRFNLATQADILPQIDNLGALMRGTIALSGGAEAYIELLASRQQTQFIYSSTPINAAYYGNYPPWIIPVGSPFYPAGMGLTGDIVNPLYRTVPLGPRINEADTESWRALMGWRGGVAGWDVDTALMYSTSYTEDNLIRGHVDSVKLSDAFAAGLINPFGDSGPAGDAALASTEIHGAVRQGRSTTQSADVHAHRDVARWGDGIVTLGLGAEARHEALVDELTSVAAAAAGFGTGFDGTQQAGARDVQALYAELALPIASTLQAQLALRTDHYSDFGSHTSSKVALRWQPSKAWMLRASTGTGFRAPSLPELFALQIETVVETGLQDPVRCPVTGLEQDCNLVASVLTGGNPALRPETSRQLSLGIVLEPLADASVSVDWYRLSLSQVIGQLGLDQPFLSDPKYQDFIIRGPTDPAFPALPGPITGVILTKENLGEQIASGVDVGLRYGWTSTTGDRFKIELAGSYLATWRTRFNGVETSVIESLPRWQHTLSVEWDRGPWRTTLGQSWRAGYVDQNPDVNGNPRRVGSYILWDAQAAFDGFTDWSLAVGVKNLFDTNPPISNQTFSIPGYDPSYADPRGRVWYVRASYGWK